MKKVSFLIVIFILFSFVSVFSAHGEKTVDGVLLKKLNVASTEHDIIQLMLKKGEYEKIPAEIDNILNLELPSKFEKAVMKEILIVSNDLHKKGENEIALLIIDKGLNYCKSDENKVILLKVKAAFLKSMGKLEEAIKVFKKAVKLEKRSIEK